MGKGINREGKSSGINRAGEGIVRTSYGNRSSKMDFYPSSSFNSI